MAVISRITTARGKESSLVCDRHADVVTIVDAVILSDDQVWVGEGTITRRDAVASSDNGE
jgi:hypothetical protein